MGMEKAKVMGLVVLAAALTGCGDVDRMVAGATGYSHLCVDGVEYLQFTSGASVAYTPEGKIKTCK